MKKQNLIDRMRSIAMSKEEFMKGAKKSSLFREVNDEIIKNRFVMDESTAKRDRDWSVLAGQSVTNPIY